MATNSATVATTMLAEGSLGRLLRLSKRFMAPPPFRSLSGCRPLGSRAPPLENWKNPGGASEPIPVSPRKKMNSQIASTVNRDDFDGGGRSQWEIRQRRIDVTRVVVSQFVTVDGVIEDPGGSEGFDRGGWAFQFDRGDEGDKFKLDEGMAADALLLGRVTYEGFADAWPTRSGEFADKFNGMPKYVVSTTMDEAEWNNSTVLEGDLATAVAELRERAGGDVVVHGSAQLVQSLIEQDLVDELRLMVFPVVLGQGKRLFGETSDKKRLKLVDSRTVGDGVALLIYRPVRDGA